MQTRRRTLFVSLFVFLRIGRGENMERATEQEQTPEIFENDIQLFLNLFCEENNIEDIKKESQSVWNSCLRYIYKHVFAGGVLKQHRCFDNPNHNIRSTYNAYNYDMVLEVLDIYIYDMCMRYDKEVSIIGFSTLTGIDESIIYDWGNNKTKLSNSSSKVYKKLNKYREESLSNKLATGKQNPVGVIAMLNRHYSWSSPYVSDANRNAKQTLTSADIKALLSSETVQDTQKKMLEISENQDIVGDDKTPQDIVGDVY